MLNQTKRIVIIGGGPAGYEAALAGAKYGAEITIIEDQGMGGNSVILDCVPSKSFIAGANIKTDLRRAEDMKLNEGIGQAHLSLTALNKRVQDLASKQSSDIRATVESLGARVIDGRGYFPEDQEADAFGGHKVTAVFNEDGHEETINADLVLVATGATLAFSPALSRMASASLPGSRSTTSLSCRSTSSSSVPASPVPSSSPPLQSWV